MQATISLDEELRYRLTVNQLFLDNHPTKAIEDMLCFAWFGYSGQLFRHAWYLQYLQQRQNATEHRQQALIAARNAFGYVDGYNYYDALINLFNHAMYSSDANEITNVAMVLKKSQQPDTRQHLYFFLPFYRPLAALLLRESLDLGPFSAALDKAAVRKNTYYPAGTKAALEAIAEGNSMAAAEAVDEILAYHAKKAAKPGSFVYNSINGFICHTATLLCITALWRGLELKPLLTKHRDTLKLMPQDLPHRTELSPKCRFLLPVDYIPDELLAPWQQQRLST